MASKRSRSAIILLRSAWVGSYNWYKANPHSRLREKCYFSSHGATRERAVAPAVWGLAPRLTPKAHTIEKHIPLIAQRFGTIGLFGQDGGEAAHPKWKTASTLCRCVSNTIARVKATKFHFEAQQHCAQMNRERKPEPANSRGSEVRRRRRRPLLGPNDLSFSEHFFLPLT